MNTILKSNHALPLFLGGMGEDRGQIESQGSRDPHFCTNWGTCKKNLVKKD
jgi:hypothetical protein